MRCSFGNRAGGTRQTRRTGGFSVIFKLIAATVSRCSGLQPLLRIQLAARMLTVLGVAAWATLIAAPASAISFTATSSMASSRTEASSTLLGNGKVLVAGGLNGLIVSSAELYDPLSNGWSSAGNLTTARYQHTATMLASGKVLVVGGVGSAGVVMTAELYDPASNMWSDAGSNVIGRRAHTATLLPSGKVLVVGGLTPPR